MKGDGAAPIAVVQVGAVPGKDSDDGGLVFRIPVFERARARVTGVMERSRSATVFGVGVSARLEEDFDRSKAQSGGGGERGQGSWDLRCSLN